MKLLFLSLFLLAFSVSYTQTLIADETTLEESKTSVKIVSSNYFMPDSVLVRFEPVLIRYSVAFKKDRAGRYREYSITLPIERKDEVVRYIQSLKRPK